MNDVRRFFDKDHFARHVGIEFLEVSKGHAKAKLELDHRHLNPLGTAHGGAIFTLADITLAAAVHFHETSAVALNMNISYIKAVRKGTLIAEAKREAANSKVLSYTVKVKTEEEGVVAVMQGLAYRKKRT